jgi:hypothetical protein
MSACRERSGADRCGPAHTTAAPDAQAAHRAAAPDARAHNAHARRDAGPDAYTDARADAHAASAEYDRARAL